MSLEEINTPIDRIRNLKSRLDKVVSLPYDKEWVQHWIKDILTHEGGEEEIENFFENVSRSEILRNTLREEIGIFEMLFDQAGKKIFNDPEDIEIMVHNVIERHKEKSKNEKESYNRALTNPYASDEEYRLGTYAESIESQVRDAVFEFQKKGYLPMESGFKDLTEGSQYIGISLEENLSPEDISNSLNNITDEKAKRIIEGLILKISVTVLDEHDRVHIVLIPKNKKMSLENWKIVWDYVVSSIPQINNSSEVKNNSSNGTQGLDFRERQDKIKAGKNAWLRMGLAFVDGKVVKMSYRDFISLEKSHD